MLEGLVANLLNRVLGMYVQNFDPKQLRIGIWNGDVKLSNLELRKEALDQLHLPLNVVEGHIGELILKIPWSNLRGAPVRVNVENVFILAAPKEDADINAEEEEQREHKLKIEKLENAELLKERNTEGMSKEEQQKQQGFVASLTTAIIDNLQITVKNIHVRYEDSLSTPNHPFAAGLTLRDFSAISTDENWKPTFIQSTSGSTHKLAKLGALAVYWDTDTELIGTGRGTDLGADEQKLSHQDMLAKFKEMIVQRDDETLAKHQYILKPVSGQAGIEMDKTGRTDRAKLKTRVFFDELGFVLDEDQYRDALMLVDLFHYFIRHQEYMRYRPDSTPKDDARNWIRFAGKSVLDKIHERNRKWSWEYFRERRNDRRRYIELFKKKKREEKFTPQETEDLNNLEWKLSYEDLRFWRSLARNQLRKENVGVSKQPATQTWGQWLWGGGQKADENADKDAEMTDEERNRLYSAIDFDEKKALADAVDLPKDTVKMQAHLSLQTGSFVLKRDPHGEATEILKLLFENFDTSFTQRPDSMLARLALQGIRLYDGTTQGSLFPQIINVKDAPVAPEEAQQKQSANNEEIQPVLRAKDEELDRAFGTGFFSFSFEQNPLDGRADTAIGMDLRSMEIVYNPKFVVETAKFFKPPERHMESIGALMETANATVEGIRKQTRAGLEFALEEHKRLDARFDIRAPLIIVPDTVTSKSALCLILDAGHASVRSKLVDQETMNEIRGKQKHQYTEQDYKRLEGLMYDKFLLKLESTQVLIGPSIEATKAQLETTNGPRNLHVIDRINMDFTIESCILPKQAQLTKFRIAGNLPVLHASVSDHKYKNLMRLLEVAIPKFDDDGAKKDEKPRQSRSKSAAEVKPPTETARPRSKSFQFSAQEHELVLEEDDETNKGDSRFKDVTAGEQATDVELHQRIFEFQFQVHKLQGSLYRADPDGEKPDKLLAELIAERFQLNFYQRPFDMVAEVTLGRLALEDHIEENPMPEFKNIVSSDDVSSSAQSDDLFKLKFTKVNPDSPEFMPEYQGFATNLDVSVSTINLVVTRKTLLTLLDFVLVTFSNSGNGGSNQQVSNVTGNHEDSGTVAKKESAPTADKIRIKAELKTISVILNNDGIRLATLSLTTASVGLTLLGNTMRLGAKLGNLSLIDDVNQGASRESSLRQLVTIQGQELADFSYETFDPDSETYPGYDSSIVLRSGSIKLNFVTEPFRKIMDFAVKFGKMQAIFNAARQAAAEQANQIQQKPPKIQFDILVRTPIVVFPRITVNDKPERDVLTAYLGEIYASNKFVPLDDSGDAETAMELSTGIRNIRLVSLLHYSEGQSEELELLDKVDLGFNITYVEHKPGYKRPDLEVRGSMSDINLKVSAPQLKLVLELSRSIPAAFATEPEEEVVEEVKQELSESAIEPVKPTSSGKTNEEEPKSPTHLRPELGNDPDKWTKVDLLFSAGSIGLELLQAKEDHPIGNLKDAGLSKFSLNDTNVKLRMLSDGALESELLIKSFTIEDTRTHEANKFRKIMSLINSDITQQFMANVTISGGKDSNLLAIVSVDSPRVILSLDYLFALQAFVSAGLRTEEPMDLGEDADTESAIDGSVSDISSESGVHASQTPKASAGAQKQESSMSIAFRINLVDAQVILLANPATSSSEAVVLGLKQAIVAQQHATTLQVEKVGMFLCRMDRFDTSRLRILDDFTIATSLDIRSQNEESSTTNVSCDIEPLVLRLSLRDILLVMQIVSKLSELSGKEEQKPVVDEPERIQHIKAPSTKGRRSSLAARRSSKVPRSTRPEPNASVPRQSVGSTVLKHEELNVHIGGIRVVLIGDQHELPFLDWSVKDFDITARDWSAALTADTSIDTFINVYNFSKSAWEPLIEPWNLGFHMSREQSPEKLSVDLFSRKGLELTLTSATIALASKSMQFLSTDEDVLSKPRGAQAPYRFRNYTGFTMDVWAQSQDGKEGSAAKLEDGTESPWRFEDPSTTRETLSPEGATGIVGIRLEGSGFDSIEKIGVNREGEQLFALSPRKDKVLHRLLVEVKLGTDNIKYVTFRSPMVVENNTQIPIEIGVLDVQEGHLTKIEKIVPGEAKPSPVGAAFMHAIVIRPDQGFGYTWSNERLFWKDLVKKPRGIVTCRGEEQDGSPPFYFQMKAIMDKNNPLTNVYPYMRIRLSAPVELQNLLPYDFKYRIYDKQTKKDWTNFLRKGGISPVHVVNLSHLLLLSVDLQDTPFKQSEFAIINSPDADFSREKGLVVKDTQDLALRLKLHYFNVPDSGGAFKVSVYCPYVILNRTGLELEVKNKAFLAAAKTAAGHRVVGENTDEAFAEQTKATPFMFSFGSDDPKNRALLKLQDSGWSKPQSFNAIGSSFDVAVPASSGRTEMHVGVTIAQGEGKYNLTNVVTVAPRYVIKNQMGEDILIREPGSSEVATIKPRSLHPVRYVRQGTNQQLSLCFPGLNNQWSSPFYIMNVGRVHVKLAKDKQRQQLIKVETLMEGATLFVHLSVTNYWPFSIKNESDTEFFFYQANPNIDEDEEDRSSGWRPIRYRLPPRSIMPYAWDYPASRNKDLVISANNRERNVKLAEIGQQIPLKLPPPQGQSRQKVIDIDVIADGPKQCLVLSNWKPEFSLYRQKTGQSVMSTSTGFEVKEQDTDVTFKAEVRLTGIGISLVNRNMKELLYVTFRDIELKYNESALFQTMKWTTKWIQIDNQLYGGIFPILLYPSVVPKTGKEMEAHPIFHAAVTRVKNDSYGVLYVKYFTVLLQQMTFEVDEDFIFALLDFAKIPGAAWSEEKEGKLCDEELDMPEPQQQEQGKDVYFELLHLQPIQIDLSFVRTEVINAEDTMTTGNNPFMFAVNVMTMSLGNVNDAPLRYNALMLENARISFATLLANIQSHYVQESLRQVHIVLGSADFLGNPVGLFNNVSSGVADIFYEPYQGLVMTDRPQDLGLGIAKGASSFVKKSVFGFSDSMAKFTSSMSKGLAAATLDKEYQDQRRMSKSRNRPKHALYGITSGGNAFASSLASGIGGLARHPMEGVEKEGLQGFVKGVGKGFLGLATKPAIGAFDLASNLAEGVRNTTTVFDQEGLDRVRLTRFVGQDGIIRPYSQREALGQFWLKTLDNGKFFNEDYIAHLELPGKEMMVMLTYNDIMMVRSKKLQTEWDVALKDVQRISKERTGMNITLKEGRNGPFVPVQDETSRNWLYRQISVAVTAYNEKWQARA